MTGLVASVGLQVARERRYPAVGSPVHELYFTSRRLGGNAGAVVQVGARRCLLDPGGSIFRQHAPRADADRPAGTRPALSAARRHDDARSAIQHRVSVWRDLSGRGYPGWAGRPDLAIKLLDKGFARNPDKWEYLYDKAFVYYWSLSRSAARPRIGSTRPQRSRGRPTGCRAWQATCSPKGGDRRSSRFLWQQILRTAEHAIHARQRRVAPASARHADIVDQLTAMLDR